MGRRKLTERVVESLLRGLADGRWSSGEALPPGRRQAAKFDVSLGPYQAAIRQLADQGLLRVRQRRPVVVADGAAQRARDLLEQRRRHPATRGLALLMPERLMHVQKGTYWHEVIQAIIREAERREIPASVVKWPRLGPVEFAHRMLTSGFSAAVALAMVALQIQSLDCLVKEGFPVMVHNRRLPWLNVPSVVRDDFRAMRRIGEIFALNDHRNMCYAASPVAVNRDELLDGRGSIDGWLDFLGQSGLLASCHPPIHIINKGYDCLDQILESANPPTALVIADAESGELFGPGGALAKVRIPDELSVAIVDETTPIPITPWRPPLTRITVDHGRYGECVLEMVEKLQAGNLHPRSVRVALQINLTDSIGPAPVSNRQRQ